MSEVMLDDQLEQMGAMMRWIDDVVTRAAGGDLAELDDQITQIGERLDAFGPSPKFDVRDDLWEAALRNARASLLVERWQQRHVVGDLDRALADSGAVFARHWSTEIGVLPADQIGQYHAVRGRALSEQADTRRPDLLDEAITHLRASVDHCPDEPYGLAMLAIAYATRIDRAPPETVDPVDRDDSIDLFERAVDGLGDDDPNLGPWSGSLAEMLVRRFLERGDDDDLEAAIAASAVAMDAAWSDQDRVGALLAKGKAARLLGERRGDEALLAVGAEALETAIAGGAGPTGTTIDAARFATTWALARGEPADAAAAGERGLAAMHTLGQRQARRGDVEVWLRAGSGLATETARAYVEAGDPASAALTLEHHRATILGELLPDPDAVAGLDTAARDELISVLGALADQDRPDDELLTLRRRRRDLLASAASDAPATIDELVSIAATVPLCYVSTSDRGTFAVVVDADGARSVELGAGTPAPVEALWRSQITGRGRVGDRAVDVEREVRPPAGAAPADSADDLGALDDGVIRPLLAAVGERLVIVPTGPWTAIPIDAFAAGRAVWTMAPSARVLERARRRRASTSGERLLAIGEPGHVGTQPLPGTIEEVRTIAAGRPSARVLTGDEATAAAVLAGIAAADLVHVACHGVADPSDPMRSELLLAGQDSLAVAELIGQSRFAGVRLAVLSACQTAVVGAHLPDESISLAAVLLFAGAAGVVGSAWPVPDQATCALMIDFYRRWRVGVTPDEALRAAQAAMRAGELGPAWTAPRNWAAFTYLGA